MPRLLFLDRIILRATLVRLVLLVGGLLIGWLGLVAGLTAVTALLFLVTGTAFSTFLPIVVGRIMVLSTVAVAAILLLVAAGSRRTS